MSEEQSTELVVIGQINAVTVFGQEGGSQSVIDAIRNQVKGLVFDISTAKGRDEIKSVAYKIARTKTALDDEGKRLKADMQKTVDLVDAERKKIRDDLDALKEEVRKPLTDLENAEKLRVQIREDRIAEISSLNVAPMLVPLSLELIELKIKRLSELEVFDWQEFVMRAEATAKQVMSDLNVMREARIKYDQEQAELMRLRAEQEKRDQAERDRKIAEEAADKARKEEEEKTNAERLAKEKAERDAEEARERAERAEADKIAAQKKADEDAEAARKKADQDAKEAAERAAQAERDRQAAEEKRKADEAAAREADKEHRAKINREVLTALTAKGLSVELAKTVITAIVKGEVPHTKISY